MTLIKLIVMTVMIMMSLGKVVQLAAERGLTTTVTSTCKVMGMKALARGNTGSAMAWALKSQVGHVQ